MVEDELRKAVAADLWTIPMGKVVDLVTRAAAEIVSLRAELAEVHKALADQSDDLLELRAAARQDAEEKARLTAALKPFVQLAEAIECTSDHTYDDGDHWEIEIGALRQARAALARRPQGEKS